MDETVNVRPRVFSVRYRDLVTWSVGAHFGMNWNWPDNIINPLSRILTRRSEAALETLIPKAKVTLLTIRFDGSIESRKLVQIKDIKGKLFRVYPGDVVFSKIDVRNGAIGLAPDNIDNMCVTSEFPVYYVNQNKAYPKYVKLVFRTKAFRKLLNSMISGTSGRKRIQPSQLEGVKVPIPPLDVQHKIVVQWETAMLKAADIKAKIEKMESDMEMNFLKSLGLKKPKKKNLIKMLIMNWKEIDRWSIKYNQLSQSASDLTHGKFQHTLLGEISAVSYGIQKSPLNRPGRDARPYLRVANVRRGTLDLSEIKYINVPDSEFDTYKLIQDDMLFVEGNGSREELGRCAIWNEEIANCVHQNHIIKVRPDVSKVNPRYAMFWFNTEMGKEHFFNNVKSSSGLGSINSTELRAAPIPLPPLDIQNLLVKQINEQLSKIEAEKRQLEFMQINSREMVETIILGSLPVEA